MQQQNYITETETPRLQTLAITARTVCLTYTRFNQQHTIMPSPEQLAKALQYLGCIEGYEVTKTGHVMVLHTVPSYVEVDGEVYETESYDGAPLRVWLHREMTEAIAQSLINIHENGKDAAMLKTAHADFVTALKGEVYNG